MRRSSPVQRLRPPIAPVQRIEARHQIPIGSGVTSSRCGSGRWSASIGDEIGDGEVGLMAHAADQRDSAKLRWRCATLSSLNAHKSSMLPPPRHRDQHVALSAGGRFSCDGGGDLLRRTFALNRRRIQDDRAAAGMRRRKVVEHVAQRLLPRQRVTTPIRRAETRAAASCARERTSRSLLKPGFEAREGFVQRAQPGATHEFHGELELTRASYSVGRARTSTCMPLAGSQSTCCMRWRNITQRTCARSSFSEK